jgi:hypothetical protein
LCSGFNREECANMATILTFTPRLAASVRPPLDVEASVIIFPGVRYERPCAGASEQERLAESAPEPSAPRH